MDIVVDVTSARDLGRIDDVVHDHWFELPDVEFDRVGGLVLIRISPDDGRLSTAGFLLEVRGATDLQIQDTERIGRYDFNRIRYDEHAQALVIETGIPLGLRIPVTRVDLSLRKNSR